MKLKTQNGKEYIFDVVRKKYVRNQPEEWVRQNIVEYLNKEKGYPISLMSVEKKTLSFVVMPNGNIVGKDLYMEFFVPLGGKAYFKSKS